MLLLFWSARYRHSTYVIHLISDSDGWYVMIIIVMMEPWIYYFYTIHMRIFLHQSMIYHAYDYMTPCIGPFYKLFLSTYWRLHPSSSLHTIFAWDPTVANRLLLNTSSLYAHHARHLSLTCLYRYLMSPTQAYHQIIIHHPLLASITFPFHPSIHLASDCKQSLLRYVQAT